ncbi:hypothetical protein [Pseudomonas sp. Irchel s3h14]|uniref:hypothetical protein n=1 Tax=Pseudomonas sp. Irchel s3h14 TaxID=2009179 RepID=UPI000BA3F896|nr:hypothetical protein [Pseudomonas sp. Irchel s3h14]
MAKKIYVVYLERGRSNPEHPTFYENVLGLKAKSPDFGGINNMCILSHHMDKKTVHMLCSSGLEDRQAVTIEEVTKKTLHPESGIHKMHTDLVEGYFLPHDSYPNIK